jgi:LysM repeat protein
MNLSTKTHSVQTLSLITDAYSTLMDSEYKSKTSNCYTLLENVDKDFSVEESLQTPFSSKVTILDVWNTPRIVSIKADNDKIDIDGKTEISVLAVDGDNVPTYFEKSVNFNVQVPIENISNKELEFDIDVYTKDIEYNNLGDKVDVKLKLGVQGSIYKNCVHNMIHDIKTNPDQPKTRDEKESVIIYYSQPGEDLWQIAKRYNTSMDALLQENENVDFDHDLIIKDKSILLIPIVSA